ncbi:MAG: transglutaminase domain-containing protein [Anaerolineae bacterium]|nr:transglutaminase domain-containing protein [Anaerolineae bacterium]
MKHLVVLWISLFILAWQATACQASPVPDSTAVIAQETPSATATLTPVPASTSTATAMPTATPIPSATPTATATLTPTPTSTATAVPTLTAIPTSTTARRLRMRYEIEHPTVLGQQTLVEQVWLPLPNTEGDGTREFELLEIYPDGYEILSLGEQNQAVYWGTVADLCAQGKCTFGYRFEVMLERPEYAIPWQNNPIYDAGSDFFKTYTRPQRGIESDSARIQALARSIVGDEANVYKQVLKIQSWVQQNVAYADITTSYPDDALSCIETGLGDCAGQSKVFVALARAVGIPARTVSGLLPFKRGEGMQELFGPRTAWFDQNLSVHVWVEIYLPPLGWVQGEPDMPGFGINRERLTTQRGPFAFPGGVCAQATYFHLPLAVQGDWCGQSVGWEVSIDAQEIE